MTVNGRVQSVSEHFGLHPQLLGIRGAVGIEAQSHRAVETEGLVKQREHWKLRPGETELWKLRS